MAFASKPGSFSAPARATLAQPLPPADGKDVGDAAKMVEKSISDALKGMPMYTSCINDLRAQKFDQAEKDARAGIAAYSNSVLSRICLLQAQTGLEGSARFGRRPRRTRFSRSILPACSRW